MRQGILSFLHITIRQVSFDSPFLSLARDGKSPTSGGICCVVYRTLRKGWVDGLGRVLFRSRDALLGPSARRMSLLGFNDGKKRYDVGRWMLLVLDNNTCPIEL